MLRGHRGRGREVALLRGTSLAPRRRLKLPGVVSELQRALEKPTTLER